MAVITDDALYNNSGQITTLGGSSVEVQSLYKFETNLVDGQIVKIKKLTVHQFVVDSIALEHDTYLYNATAPLLQWQSSESGQWVLQHAVETPEYHKMYDVHSGHTKYVITARFTEKDATWFLLKWNS